MPAYTVRNTRGITVARIGVSTTTGSTFPLELVGMGIRLYGGIIAQDQYRQLENFAAPTPPAAPVEGQFWYDRASQIPNFYNGTNFVPILGATRSSRFQFPMLPRATAIDFTTAGNVSLFTATNGPTYHPTALLLIPHGTITTSTPPAFNLNVLAREDVMDTVVITQNINGKHQYYPIYGATKFAAGVDTIRLEITTPALGGACAHDAYLFGFIRY